MLILVPNFSKEESMKTSVEASGHICYQASDLKIKSTHSSIKKWLHQHPTVQNTAILALAILGIKISYEGLQNYSFYAVAAGMALIGSAYILQKALPIFIPPSFNPDNRSFATGTCRGVSLTYHGNLPILKIPKEVSPFDAGYARGYMMAAQIKDLWEKTAFAFHTILGLPRDISWLINNIKEKEEIIPKEYITEMKGMVEGYNDKRKTWKFLKGEELSLDILIYFHLIPELEHLDFKETNQWAQRQEKYPVGCTVVIDGNQSTGPLAVRTIDWIPMDTYGKCFLVELRETADGLRYINQNFPLFIGCLTAMNAHGLCAAINVARGLTDYPKGMPAVFYIRKMIESCTSIQGEKGAKSFWEKISPLGSFNLSVLDSEQAASVHFYQADDNKHYVRWWKEESELITLNYRYGKEGETNSTIANSLERSVEIKNYYNNLKKNRKYEETNIKERLEGVLKGVEVNNIGTVSTAYIDPRNRIFKHSFNNGYAADQPLLETPLDKWFSKEI